MQSISLNPPMGPVNTRGVPYTDYVHTSSGTRVVPWDAVALQVCAIGGGGHGGAGGRRGHYTTLNIFYAGQGGAGGGSGHIENSEIVPVKGETALTIQVGAPGATNDGTPDDETRGGGSSSVAGDGINVMAPGGLNGLNGRGGHGNTTNSYNWGGGPRGGHGGAGGGGGGPGVITSGGNYSRGRGGNGYNSTGSPGQSVPADTPAGSTGTNNGGNGGAWGGANGGILDVAAVSLNTDALYAFGDRKSGVYLQAQGGDGGESPNNRRGGKGAVMGNDSSGQAYSGVGYGRGGNGGNGRSTTDGGTAIPGTPGAAGVVVIRVFWE